jgi:hypothetical protein
VQDEGAQLAAVGVAMLGFDAPFHGDRSIGVDPETALVSNIVLGREMMRQSVLDVALLVRMAQEGLLDAPDGRSTVQFARSPVLYMGHSQGAQLAGIMLGVEPSVGAAFLSEAGGDAAITAVEREVIGGTTVACFIAGLIGEDCAEMTEDHPLLTVVAQPVLDPADPLSYAHRMLQERPTDWTPVSIAMTEGLIDMYTPPRTIEALATAIGLPIVEPVESTTTPYEIIGAPSVAPPVSGNLVTPGGATVTGGLMQFPGFDHFVIYRNPDATNRYVQFLRTAATGTPTIVGP